MAQFDVYRNPSPASSKRVPYLVEVQGNYCDIIATCVVIPLAVVGEFIPAPVLNPTFEIADKKYLLSTPEITAVTRSRLGRPIGSLSNHRTEIIQAIDRLLL
jgi:toxin CcdB